MSLPYPYYTQPQDDYIEVEAILTIIHEEGPNTVHPVIVQLDPNDADDDLVSAVIEDRYWANNPEALEAALATKADFQIEYWEDVETTWQGVAPFAA
ncbi:hypothetical protein HMPREF2526_06200 [Corynebacterium sp. HMSC070E08]|uniref:hypothetical protein n=1 Tax=Corynebacterium sp. HMSC070E08 TaxID=1715006 RepID=UPI0008A35D67|nr:hypothetical protein [Corynebacterium sp. HMSC070E08]OFN80076.1 hypothetical protein HMPREF2526_06200 [Corynebacterium sp. HMSC070E08]